MPKQGVMSAQGTASAVKSLCYYWMLVDSKTTGALWEFDEQRRIWRRTTMRAGR